MSLQFAKFSAYEMLLREVSQNEQTASTKLEGSGKALQWSGQKVQLAELIYALDALKVFGNENTMFVAETISKQWNVHLSFIHKTFEEIRLRKKTERRF